MSKTENDKKQTSPADELHTALMKIRSIIFNQAQEHRIKNLELEDFNDAAAKAFSALDEIKILLKKEREEKTAAYNSRNAAKENEKKIRVIIQMLGLSDWGLSRLLIFPYEFLVNIDASIHKNKTPIHSENHFWLIEHKYRTIQALIDRDRMNINSIEFHRKFLNSENSEVKKLAREILIQISNESMHIIDGLRKGKSFEELKTRIENHWYEQIQSHNLAAE